MCLEWVFAFLMLVLPKCTTEDGTWCYWDGGSNQKGFEFVTISDGEQTTTVYGPWHDGKGHVRYDVDYGVKVTYGN